MRRSGALIALFVIAAGGMGARADLPPVDVVLYTDRGPQGDLDRPYKPSDEGSCFYAFDCENIVRTVKALQRHFRASADLDGRVMRLTGVRSIGDVGAPCATRRADAVGIAHTRPDLVIHLGGGMRCFVEELATRFIPSFGLDGLPADAYADHAPYVWTFAPSIDAQAAMSASFLCRTLLGERARFAGDPLLQQRTRTFALIEPASQIRDERMELHAQRLRAEVLTQCGMTFDARHYYEGSSLAGWREAAAVMADLRTEQITTVVCLCMPRPTETTVTGMQAAATATGYLPEWYWDTPADMDRGVWHKLFQTKLPGGSFGWSWLWRLPALEETPWYQAYRAQEPDTAPNTRFLWHYYHLLELTYRSLAATMGSTDPNEIRDALFGTTIGDAGDPTTPTGAFGDARDPYALIDTGIAYWWDELGTPPGGTAARGCLRMVHGGTRSDLGTWPVGDDGMFAPDDPCSESIETIYGL